jgi:hypothetical protein
MSSTYEIYRKISNELEWHRRVLYNTKLRRDSFASKESDDQEYRIACADVEVVRGMVDAFYMSQTFAYNACITEGSI